MTNTITAAVHTLGCKVNQCDGEALISKLQKAGISIQKFDQKSDIYIINTCTVTHTSDKKSLQMIRRARKFNPSAFIAVCGCLPNSLNETPDKITIAGADFIFDTRKPELLLDKLSEIYQPPAATLPVTSIPTRTRAFIKIQDGCDRYCTYCIVPYVRGPIQSRPLSDILEEAKKHIKNGALEIVITGIQVASYGYDTGCVRLPELIKHLVELEPKRLRLSSIDPWAVDDAFLSVVDNSPTLCSHFHLSLQSGSDKTLANMNRRYTTKDYAKAANKLKNLRSNVALTTDIIVGFPGETDEDFKESLHFAEDMGFSKIHVFEYSQRAGTQAATFPNQVPSQVKSARGEEMRALAKKLEQIFMNKQIGTNMPVLFETKTNPNTWQGHTENYCTVQVQGTDMAGTIQKVKITGISGNSLIGQY